MGEITKKIEASRARSHICIYIGTIAVKSSLDGGKLTLYRRGERWPSAPLRFRTMNFNDYNSAASTNNNRGARTRPARI